ncbi:MAG: dTMP kinase [Balneolales bacterium]
MLITFEGIDGCGKSTQIKLLQKSLEEEGFNPKIFREPGGTKVSEEIRSLLLSSENTIDPITEALLFSSARSKLISEVVKPSLDKGDIVILDRFYDSTIAYQGYGRKSMSLSDLHKLNMIASHGLVPDITFYLKISIEQSEQRRKNLTKDRMENSGNDFYSKVITGFDDLSRQEKRFVVINALNSIEDISKKIKKKVMVTLGKV